jgi:hypothetical protein
MLEVPYSTNFQVEEKWEATPIEGFPNKCKLTVTGWAVILKSFMLQSTV